MSINSELLDRMGNDRHLLQSDDQSSRRAIANASPAEAPDTIGQDLNRLVRDEQLKLIQQVFLLPYSPRRQAVLFAEVERCTESAAICAQAAELLADQAEGSVCVADLDLREPSLHHFFRLDGGSAASGARQVGGNLWFLPSGSRMAERHTVHTPDRLRSLFQDLREQFDYVLIKAPPFSQCADSVLLSQLSDGVVLVVEAHTTRRDRARKVKESLAAAQVPLLGVVLNNRTFPIPERLYRSL